MATVIIAGYLFLNDKVDFLTLYEVGKKLGQTSLVLYLITLTPGILKRLNILLLVGTMLHLFRRQFGVLMFLTAWTHSTFLVTLPQIQSGQFVNPLAFQLFGVAAFYLLLPLWATSNDFSKVKMGAWWKRLHRLTYIALFLIYFHVALQLSNWRWPVMLFLGLEILSWAIAWWRLLSAKPQPIPLQTPPMVK